MDDSSELETLLTESFGAGFNDPGDRTLARLLSSTDEMTVVALDGSGSMVACLMASVGHVNVLHTLCVAPAHRRQSVARNLLEMTLQSPEGALSRGPACVLVSENGLPLLGCFRQLGFVELPRLRSAGQHEVAMVRLVRR